MSARQQILDATSELLLTRGFASTTVDAILERAGVSKGAFFHHFPTKAHLGRAVVEQYAEDDGHFLETFMGKAEAEHDDPARQLVTFLASLETASDELLEEQPACLFVSFIYERDLADADTDEVVRRAVLHWRDRIFAKLEAAAAERPDMPTVDLESLADQVFTTIEGALLLSRALDRQKMGAQLAHVRHYLELLFGLPVQD